MAKVEAHDNGERCLNCICWCPPKSELALYGMCRRFPRKTRKPATEWCAEWAPIPKPKAEAVAERPKRLH